MKPTDIWTNHPDPQFLPPCKNGDPCHEKAPRGSKTGTQGIKGARERGRIPAPLCEHIVDISEQAIETIIPFYVPKQKARQYECGDCRLFYGNGHCNKDPSNPVICITGGRICNEFILRDNEHFHPRRYPER